MKSPDKTCRHKPETYPTVVRAAETEDTAKKEDVGEEETRSREEEGAAATEMNAKKQEYTSADRSVHPYRATNSHSPLAR